MLYSAKIGWLGRLGRWGQLTIIAAMVAFLIFLAIRTNWLPCLPDCSLSGYPLPGESRGELVRGEAYLSEGPTCWFLKNIPDEKVSAHLYSKKLKIDEYIEYVVCLIGGEEHDD